MLGTIHLTAFILSGIGVNLYPGPDTFYIIGRSLAQGRRAGILSALGISTGGLCHTLLAGLGLSALLMTSPALYRGLQLAGSAYLVYLGARFLIGGKRDEGQADTYSARLSDSRIYGQGVLTNLLNPKVALFFLSYLPQFVDPASNRGIRTFLFLGLIFVTTGTLWCMALALFASRLRDAMGRNQKFIFFFEKFTGLVLIGLGIALFL
jgi:threonine/homoserine/homoserine lactone efflux protein